MTGQPRNPVLLARAHWPEVFATATGDAGARSFLRSHADLVTLVECGDTGRPDDIDTPADLARIAGCRSGALIAGYEAWMPQLCVTSWLVLSTSRSSPVAKAFGGQVMGSTASALRRRSGPSGSPVNTCSQR